jgi:hypothetical protein
MCAQRLKEIVLKAAIASTSCRGGADKREPRRLEECSDILLAKVHSEPLLDYQLEVDTPPVHHTIGLSVGAGVNQGRQFTPLLQRQTWRRAVGPRIQQCTETIRTETVTPVEKRLALHAARPDRVVAAHTTQHRRQRKESPTLTVIPRLLCQPAKFKRRKIRSQGPGRELPRA